MEVPVPLRGEELGHVGPVSTLSPAAQCLKPEDVAEAVIYVLSTPPHVQVSLPLAAYPREAQLCPEVGRPQGVLEGAAASRLLPSTGWRHPDEAHRAGDLVFCGELLPSPPSWLASCLWILAVDFWTLDLTFGIHSTRERKILKLFPIYM